MVTTSSEMLDTARPYPSISLQNKHCWPACKEESQDEEDGIAEERSLLMVLLFSSHRESGVHWPVPLLASVCNCLPFGMAIPESILLPSYLILVVI